MAMENTSNNLSYMKYEETKLEYEDYTRACQEIGENAKSRQKCLKTLRNYIKESEDIPNSFDDEFLLRYLKVSKFDCNKAFDRLRRFYTIQKKYKDFFYSKNALSKVNLANVVASPYRMDGNIAIIINKYSRLGTTVQSLNLKEKYYLDALVGEKVLSNPVNQLCGIAIILDSNEFSFSQMIYYTPRFLRMFLECAHLYPVRLKLVFVVNNSTAGKLLFNVFQTGFSRKLKSRIHFHAKGDGWDLLHSYIPPDMLPDEYGGRLKSEDMINLLDDVRSTQARFHKNSPVKLTPHAFED